MLPYTAMRSPAGRYYVRHSSGMGTVMHTNILGEWKKILILDKRYWKKYKNNSIYTTSVGDKLYSILNSFCWRKLSQRHERINLSRCHLSQLPIYNPIFISKCTDDYLNRTYSFFGSESSHENCDNWIEEIKNIVPKKQQKDFLKNSPITYCRSIKVNGIPCDLPNIHILMRLYVDEAILLFMDPYFRDFELKEKYSIYNLLNVYDNNKYLTRMERTILGIGKVNEHEFHTPFSAFTSSTFPFKEAVSYCHLLPLGIFPTSRFQNQFHPMTSNFDFYSIPILKLN